MKKANLTRDEAEARARLIEVDGYRIELDLTRGELAFGSDTTVRFRCAEPGATTFIDLQAAGVDEIELNGERVEASAFDGTRIKLAGLDSQNELRIRATCEYQRTGVGMHRTVDPVDKKTYVYTQMEPFDANRVFACFDQPDLKATFDISVLAPDDWVVISNGAPASTTDNRWTFVTTPRMSTYLACVCGGPFHSVTDSHRGIDLGLWCRRSLAEHLDPDAAEMFEITKQGFDFFEDAFGYPYPFGKYDQVFCPEYKFGAMENAGCVTFTDAFVFRSKVTDASRESRAEVILHEMAHMWFGDLVTMRWWDDLWLNESFATYASMVASARATRFRDAWTTFATGTKAWAYAQDQLPTTHPITADIPDTEATHLNFDGITYAKGASVLKQLVAWVGDDAFYNGMKDYFRRHEWGNTELGDFLSALEKGSGRDLASWSQEWLQTTGVNAIRVETEASGGTYTSAVVTQDAADDHPTLRSHRLRVGLYDSTGEGLVSRRSVELDISGPRTAVDELAGEREADLLLPNDGDLTYAKIRFDDRSLATLKKSLRDLRDPLARALSWGALFDMLRDAELPARRYLEILLNNVGGETEISAMQAQLGRTFAAADVYGDPSNREAARASIAAAALDALRAAEPAGDVQLAWAHVLIGSASTEADLGLLRSLLDGTETIEGLAVDTDVRWGIVRALVASGAAGEELIEAEYERDPSDRGERLAAGSRAAMPTADAKAEAWERVTEDEELSVAMMRSIVGGFHDYGQTELLEPYVDRYFGSVAGYWEAQDIEKAFAFASGMFPQAVRTERVLELADAEIARTQVPPLRRILLEARDTTRRAIAARRVDAADPS